MTEEHMGATRIAGPESCSRILLVGELNPYGADPRYALYCEPPNSAGWRLQRLIFGIGGRNWYLPMWRINLCTSVFDRQDASAIARGLLDATLSRAAPWSTIVMLGKRVQSAFEHVHEPFTRAGPLICLPHPSGRNAAAWADPTAIDRTRELMRDVAPLIPWGEFDDRP